jgi:hypothetical protein
MSGPITLIANRPPEPCVARAQHFAEPAGADAIEDLVLSERLDHEARRLY